MLGWEQGGTGTAAAAPPVALPPFYSPTLGAWQILASCLDGDLTLWGHRGGHCIADIAGMPAAGRLAAASTLHSAEQSNGRGQDGST